MTDLMGKVAVVTGGSSGIGLATAKELHGKGASVVIFGRDPKTLTDAACSIGENVIAVQGDASNMKDLDALFAEVKKQFGKIDILFVNAGIAEFAPLENVDEAFFDKTMDINFKGAYFTVQKALPMLGQGSSVVFTTSATWEMGAPNISVYAPSKAALRSLVRQLAVELSSKGIRVNSISPGATQTSILGKTGMSPEQVQAVASGMTAHIPLGRFANPEEIAKAVAFIASPDASYMQGAELVVDGGYSQL